MARHLVSLPENSSIAQSSSEFVETGTTVDQLTTAVAAVEASFLRPYDLGTPDAASATAIAAAKRGDAATNAFTVTQPDVPRVAVATFGAHWDGGNIAVTYTDSLDTARAETLASNPGSTSPTTYAVKSGFTAAKTVVGTDADIANTCTLGTTDLLGLPAAPASSVSMVNVAGSISGCVFDTDHATIDATEAGLDGSTSVVVFIPVTA